MAGRGSAVSRSVDGWGGGWGVRGPPPTGRPVYVTRCDVARPPRNGACRVACAVQDMCCTAFNRIHLHTTAKVNRQHRCQSQVALTATYSAHFHCRFRSPDSFLPMGILGLLLELHDRSCRMASHFAQRL